MTSIGEGAFYGCTCLTSITIPDSVTSIGYSAFNGCSSLTSITIGNGVTSIGYWTFSGCSGLESINVAVGNTAYHSAGNCLVKTGNKTLVLGCMNSVIPTDGSVTSIGYEAFYSCSSLASVTIPDSVTSIGGSSFQYCSSLTSITIPDSVTSIGSSSLSDCSGLESINVAEGNTVYHSAGNCLIETESKTLVLGCMDSTIPTDGSVTSIGSNAFSGCTSLTSITIPDSVTSIGSNAFSGCSSLEAIYITDIAAWCGIDFGDSYANPLCYAHNLYLNSELVTELVIPDGVTSIGNYAFSGYSSLMSVTISDSVTSIGGGVFSGCTGLTSITIPDSVTIIGDYVFYGCSSLEAVYITDVAAWCGIDFGGYYANPLYYAHNLYLNGEPVTELVIPDGVTSIGSCAFSDCSSLTSITIPDSVTSIGYGAFRYCSSLTSITIPDSVTSIGNGAFYGCSSLESISVAKGNTVYHSAGNCLIETESKTLVAGCKNSVIPTDGSVTSIGWNAFYDCSSLTSITIPDRAILPSLHPQNNYCPL